MLIPNFSLQSLIPVHRDAGEAFQAFVSDLLKRDLPGLEQFPALGKDGCIDFCHTDADRRLVGDCKFMEEGDAETALREWNKVARKLREHLSNPAGPTIGQAQYRPWYLTDPPIREFYLCINAELSNLHQVTSLEEAISHDFVRLGDDFPHIVHLRGIRVTVLHWARIRERLEAHPFIFFKWFRESLIPGLEPIDSPSQLKGFRAYLGNDKLPYYGIADHKENHPIPAGNSLFDEEELLELLRSGSEMGIIVTGGGGLGKSRLSLQLARTAMMRDWPVFRVRRLGGDTIERLARIVGTATPALLVFDYVETQQDFAQVTEDILQINDQTGCRLRYVASCRSSYYRAAIQGRIHHREVNLAGDDAWMTGYRQAAVRHILEAGGISADGAHLAVCKGIPVLAVFMTYLRAHGREEELHELIGMEDFGAWVVKRLDATFGRDGGRDLASLVGLFPMPTEAAVRLGDDRFGRLFATLAEDGWIEEREWDELHEGPVWGTVHDVLADGVMLAHLRAIEKTAPLFVDNFLKLASRTGLLRSALTSLQRITLEPPLQRLDWLELLSAHMEEEPVIWQGVRDMLLTFAGLEPRQRILLLNRAPTVWEGAEEEVPIQNALGWIARWVAKEGAGVSETEEKVLRQWLLKAVACLTSSNYLLNWGLRLYPELLRDHALAWCRNHPYQFQTHFIIVAWLERGLPPPDMKEWVVEWSARNGKTPHFSFLASAWLDANGESPVIEAYIRAWLDFGENRTSEAASHVYPSWLDATKDGAFVKDDIRAWLDVPENRTSEAAHFVYKSWLNATKDGGVVKDDIRAWLDFGENRTSEAAHFVYKSWLDATKDGGYVKDDIRVWLDFGENRTSEAASHVYTSWLDATKDGGFVKDDIRAWLDVPENRTSEAARFVYQSWLDATKDGGFVKDDIRAWLDFGENRTSEAASHVYPSWLDATKDGGFVKDDIRVWITLFAEHFEADYVYRAWLESGGNAGVVVDAAIRWLRCYHDREEAVFVTKFLAKLPALPLQAVIDILAWCRIFPDHEDALWRLTRSGKHLSTDGVESDLCLTCSTIFDRRLCRPVASGTAEQISAAISYLIAASNRSPEIKEEADRLFLLWLRHPSSYGVRPPLFDGIQRKSYLQRVVECLQEGKLTLPEDRDALERFLLWVNCWKPERKKGVFGTIRYLRHIVPDPELWDIVKFDGN